MESSTPVSPARSPRTRCSRRSAMVEHGRRQLSRQPSTHRRAGCRGRRRPIENVVNGTVRENYDLLLEHDLAIVGEVVVPVRLSSPRCPARASTRSSGCTRTSRPLDRPRRSCGHGRGSSSRPTTPRGPANPSSSGANGSGSRRREPRPCSDSTSSRTTSRTSRTTGRGSSSLRRPARTSRCPGRRPAATTLALAVRNEPGTPRVLEVFARHGLNMSKLESRPSRERAGIRLLGRPRRGCD